MPPVTILPADFMASTTAMMLYIYDQFQVPIILIISVVLVGALVGMIIHHFQK